MSDFIDAALLERLTTFRRDLHRHPELSWEETRTADQVCRFLDELGVAYRRDVAKTGVIAEIPGATGDEAFVAIRADLDALPIHEETGLPFASEHHGLMHACGHDGHTSIALGAGQLLAASGDPSS